MPLCGLQIFQHMHFMTMALHICVPRERKKILIKKETQIQATSSNISVGQSGTAFPLNRACQKFSDNGFPLGTANLLKAKYFAETCQFWLTFQLNTGHIRNLPASSPAQLLSSPPKGLMWSWEPRASDFWGNSCSLGSQLACQLSSSVSWLAQESGRCGVTKLSRS